VLHLFLLTAAAATVVPLLWVWSSALRPRVEIFANPFGLPTRLFVGNLVEAWTHGRFSRYMVNSLVVAVPVVLGTAVCSVLAGFALGVLGFRRERMALVAFLVGYMMPFQAIMIPIYFLIRALHLMNTYWALILPEIALYVPFGVFLMRNFFREVPRELLDAAIIDGCGAFQALRFVAAPVARPAILSLAIFTFMWNWNTFLLPLLVIQRPDMRTLPLGLMCFQSRGTTDWALIAAAVTIISVPIMIFYVLTQRYFIRGVASGALKE
jgi:raffinose/stachyose/melibiose transport system permease protein